MYELLASREGMNRVSADFLKVDLETALIFAQFAQQTDVDSRRKRNCDTARKAYDMVVNLIQKVELSAKDRLAVQRRLAQLKPALEALGEKF
jgi:hypothetical protein